MNRTTPAPFELDADALRAELIALAGKTGELSGKPRAAVLTRVKQVLSEGRAAAEKQLIADGKGAACARRLSDLQDTVIRAIYDLTLDQFYGGGVERMAVVAVGGYGRGTLAPGSDVDLLFLRPGRQTLEGEKAVEFILYFLWDLGLKVGHATRTVSESLALSRSDMTIRTAILEARHVVGDRDLTDELIRRFDSEVVKGTGPEFIAAKLAERDQRHRQQGASRYLVEPNVKEGKGGLRDLNTLFWIAKYYYRVSSGDDLVKIGVFSKEEMAVVRKAANFLWAVRCHLHFMTGRAEERLSFDVQREMARRLGYTAHPGLREVERFMKHYFLIAKDVGDLTNILCSALEERHAKTTPRLNRFFRLPSRRPRKIAGDFVVENGRINISEPEAFERDPVNLIRIFHAADRYDLAFHPEAMHQIARSLKLIDAKLRDDVEANRLFVEILSSRHNPELILRRMNEAGVLGRFVTEFGKVVAMMQFNMYHHYTVDEHLIRAIGVLAEIERGDLADSHPLANEIMPQIKDRVVLYVALFLHDIAKGRPEDHSLAGERIARRLGPRFGLSPAETETVAWLVRQHLTMSITAQSRDLNDRKTILDFAGVVQTMDRMRMLLVLTVADIKAVGPGVWNGWKGQLLRTLYYETEPVLTGGHSQISRDRRVAEARQELTGALAAWPSDERKAYIDLHYPAYFLRVDLTHKVAHAALWRQAKHEGRRLATAVSTNAFQGITEITVLAPDHPRLLSIIAGACTVAGGNIVDAQVFTTADGQALDSISISREFTDEEDENRRARRIGNLIEQALSGTVKLPEIIAAKAPRSRQKAFTLETSILVDNSWSNRFTVIEASGLDRAGLLYDLTRAISDLSLNIASAHIVTFGERAVDVFYVTDLVGQKISNPAREAAIRRRLQAAFDAAVSEPVRTRKRELA
jgi:[protein-PII] uridylyltransferase